MKGFVKEITKQIRYRDWLARLILPLLAAHYVLAINEPEPFWDFIQLPGYPMSLLQNWVLTFLVFNLIYVVTKVLDRKAPWTKNFLHRFLFQVLFGIIVPSIITLILVYIFFSINGVDILATNYLRLDWWFAILFIILANAYYIIHYFTRFFLIFMRQRNVFDRMGLGPTGVVVRDGKEMKRIPNEQVTYIATVDNGSIVYTVSNEQYLTDKGVDTLSKELNRHHFCKISRWHIVNRHIVMGYGPATSNRVRLKTTLAEEFYVSQRYTSSFKKWWERG